ncbi:MAG TPA: carboxymuconolactone decarboxylase family protein, partial [Vicinamibacteria bacterium]
MARRALVAMVLLGSAAAALPLAGQMKELNLRGDRFKPLTRDELTPEQEILVKDLLAGARGTVSGPFNALLRSPEMGNHAQKLGEYVRFKTSVPKRLNEMAILMTARFWSSQYEWFAHERLAREAGLGAAVIADIHAGRRPAGMEPDETVVYDFCTELRERRRVSDGTFAAAVELLGEKGVIDLI